MDLKKKIGPLPVWAWGLILGVAGYYFYVRNAGGSSTNTNAGTSGPTVLDPNAIDPNTGLTYGQEEDAALNANAGAGSLGGTAPGEGNLANSTSELGDLEGLLTEFGNVAQMLGYTPPGQQQQPTVQAPTGSPTSNGAATSPPMQANASPPTTTASAHTNPQIVAPNVGKASQSVQDQLSNLVSQGFRKVAGTTQKGGLSQTGTYVKGNTKYFVWGTQATGLHIRKAN